jgi:ribonuclease BN (tRNA processing enzyme)
LRAAAVVVAAWRVGLSAMKLILLGTTGYHPNNRRHTACLMLPEAGVVFDAGSGMFRVRGFLQTPQLDIFITHAHLDHILGLTFLIDVLWQSPCPRARVHASADTISAIDEHLFAEALFPVKPPADFLPLDGPVALEDGGVLRYFPVEHPGGATGYRIDWPDRSMAYVTDTTARADAPYVDEIRGVDLLVHECYFDDSMADWAKQTGHSSVTPVAEVAREADVGRLVLVHLNPTIDAVDPIGVDTARRIFPATELGEDLAEIEF